MLFAKISVVFLVVFPVAVMSFAAEESGFANLESIIGEALKNNPDIRVARYEIEALDQRPDQVASLPNPALSFGLVNVPTDSLDFHQEAMTQKTVGLTQTFPYPGKRALKRAMAERDVLSGNEELKAIKLRVVKEIKKAYYALFFIKKSVEITERNKTLLTQFIRIAETKYSVGTGVQQDVLKAQVELSRLLEKLIVLEEKRNTLKARLNSLMNRMPQAPLGDPVDVELASIEISVDDLQKMAQIENPHLKSIAESIEKNRTAHLLAEKEYYPDFNVSVQYGRREDGGGMERADFASAIVQLKVPLWHKTNEDKKVVETNARSRQMEENYESARNGLFFKIKKLADGLKSDYEKALLFREGIIEQAKASLDSAVSGYQVSKVDFLTLLDNQITLFNYEIEYYRALTDHEIKLAEMEEAVGGVPVAEWGIEQKSEVKR